MKKQILTFILLLFASNLFAQYNQIIKIAKSYEQQGEYYKAIVTYNATNVAPDKPENNNINERINYCGDQLNQLKTKAETQTKLAEEKTKEAEEQTKEAEEQTRIAEQEKEKAQKALAKAEEMQEKMETAIFDKAVKEQ